MNLIVSPHLDDAVLSCGQMIADNTDCTVVTVFAGIPTFDILTPYDEQSAFTSSRDAVVARRAEDIRAMRVLGAEYLHLDLQDSQYQTLKAEAVKDELERVILEHFPEGELRRVIGPLGQRHPDHQCVSDALIELEEDRIEMDLFLYEEIPYRVLWPVEAAERLVRVLDNSIDLVGDPASLGVGNKDRKREAVRCYVSQAWSTDSDCVFVPERFWKVTEE